MPAEPDKDDGPVLPAKSTDETDTGWGDSRDQDRDRDDDRRLLEDRPPHWDNS